MRVRLMEAVHRELAQVVRAGDFAIDATIGNGHDTLFLAKLGVSVIGFDVQEQAIENTESRIREAGCWGDVMLFKVGHENMLEYVPRKWVANVRVIMFNLGYLPGGDKQIITRPQTTVDALRVAYEDLLVEGGYLSIVVYPDHPGGAEEAEAVREWVGRLKDGVKIRQVCASLDRGPEWFLVRKGVVSINF